MIKIKLTRRKTVSFIVLDRGCAAALVGVNCILTIVVFKFTCNQFNRNPKLIVQMVALSERLAPGVGASPNKSKNK